MTVLDFNTEDTLDSAIDESGMVHDGLGDHNGTTTSQLGYQYGSLTRGLVAYYAFDEQDDDTIAYDSALNNDGTINGATRVGSGSAQVGEGAMDFDGTGDLVTAPDNDVYDLDTSSGDELTVSFWIKAPSQTGNPAIIGKGDSSGGTFQMWDFLVISDDQVRVSHQDGTNNISSLGGVNTGVVLDDTWQHIVGVWTGDTDRIYVNGSEVDSADSSSLGSSENNDNLEIGGSEESGDYLDGLLDDIRIYDRALSATEIETLSNLTSPSGLMPRSSDVPGSSDYAAVSRYEFENDVTDSWGTNDGTDNTSAGYVSGRYGQAKDFDGTDDNVTASALPSISETNDITWSLWFNADSVSSDQTIMEHNNGSSDRVSTSINGANSEAAVRIYDGTTNFIASGDVNAGEWNHVVGTWEASTETIHCYINSVEKASSNAGTVSSSQGLTIGSRVDGNDFFSGSVDDLRFYSRALTPVEIENLYYRDIRRIPRGDVLL